MTTYRGYEIRVDDTMGNGKTYYEAWKDGQMWGFAMNYDVVTIMIDRMIEEENK